MTDAAPPPPPRTTLSGPLSAPLSAPTPLPGSGPLPVSPGGPPAAASSPDDFITRLKRHRLVAVVLLVAAIVGGVASFTDSAGKLIALVRPAKAADPRAQLTQLGLPFDPDAFVTAAAKGDESAVRLYLAAGMAVDAASPRERTTALIAAVRGHHEAVVKQLLAAQADPSHGVGDQARPLAVAAAADDLPLTRLLLAANPDPAVVRQAYRAAAIGGQVEALKLLAARPAADPGALATEAMFDIAALDDAPAQGGGDRAQVAAFLLGQGVDPKAVDAERHWTLLHHAAYHGAEDVARQLLAHGAVVDARDSDGATPLWWAAGVGLHEAASLLLDRGADATLAAKDGTTVMGRARFNKDDRMVALLKAHGAR